MAEVKQAERDLVKQEFKNLFNAVYGDEIQVTLKDSFIKRNNVYARIRTHGAHRVELGINWKKWQENSQTKQMSTLLHELSHIDHDNHKIEFWKTYANNYLDAREQLHLFERNYDWDEVGRQIIFDAHENTVDRRQLSVGEMRAKLENILGIEVDDNYARTRYQAKFDDVDTISSSINAGYSVYPREIFDWKADRLVFEGDYTTRELWKKFKEVRRKDPRTTGSKDWIIPAPNVENPRPSSYEESEQSIRDIVFCTEEDEKLAQIFIAVDSHKFRPKWDSC